MRISLLLLRIAVCLLIGNERNQLYGQEEMNIIPKPVSIQTKSGRFTLTSRTTILLSSRSRELRAIGEFIAIRAKAVTGFPLPISTISAKTMSENAIILNLNPNNKSIPAEGYRLIITPDSIRISASSGAGVFYGVQSLIQLSPTAIRDSTLRINADWSWKCVEIVDSARFKWRGMHLDVGRHFFPKEFIKKYIDLMASYKLNTFHWHLTEDQGWRIEIKKYPSLTEIGSKRSETAGDSTSYGGFYTQNDIREIVRYARDRFITIVPEIEMPGHSLAALASYPELSCTGGPFKVGTVWGVFDDVYCAGNEKTFEFLRNVLTEVIALFPGEVIHIGGDEVPKTRWKVCPKCQARIKSEGLKDESELQSYFIRRIEKFLNSKGKRIIGWDEILEGGIAPNASVMSWRGTSGGIAAAKAGHDAVMTPGEYCYFDHSQAKSGEPKGIGGFLPIDSVYAYDPVPPVLTPEESRHILGAQGNMWTEYMPNERHVEYMLMPRMLALSEMLWLPKPRRDYSDFQRRLQNQYDRLALRDVNYRVPTPGGIGAKMFIFGDTLISLSAFQPEAKIRYTLDGSEPGNNSSLYTSPILIHGTETLSARTVMKNGRMSNIVTSIFTVVNPNANGLDFDYYEGAWDSIPVYTSISPVRSGRTYDVSLDGFPHRDENFALRLTGFLMIEKEGEYAFYLSSDDGSKLFIDNTLIVNNDGLHGTRTVDGKAILGPGKHKIMVSYVQKTGGASLLLEMAGAQMIRQPIPISTLSYK